MKSDDFSNLAEYVIKKRMASDLKDPQKSADMLGNAALNIEASDYKSSDGRPDALAIMAEIRRRIKVDFDKMRDQGLHFKPAVADFNQAPRRAGELLGSEELRYLNVNHNYPLKLNHDALSSHRGGALGKAIVGFKRKLRAFLLNRLFSDYLHAQRDYNANLVRLLNDVSKYVDARDAANFWELIKKVDVDVSKALERIERVADEQNASSLGVERRVHENVAALRQQLDLLRGEVSSFSALASVVSGLEGIVSRLGAKNSSSVQERPETLPDYSYLLLENRFRGSQEEVAKRVQIYPELFRDQSKPILEIGCGRGELLSIFKERSIKAYGLDLDQGMLEVASSKGLDARLGDGIAHLRDLPDASLGGVIAIQVVEHLPNQVLRELMQLCATKVSKGGLVVFETINPRSLTALSSNYFRDPTHVWPLHPDTLGYGMTLAGLELVETRFLSPVPAAAQLQAIALDEFMSPRWAHVIESLNRNFAQLNELLFGCQDYCVIAKVR